MHNIGRLSKQPRSADGLRVEPATDGAEGAQARAEAAAGRATAVEAPLRGATDGRRRAGGCGLSPRTRREPCSLAVVGRDSLSDSD